MRCRISQLRSEQFVRSACCYYVLLFILDEGDKAQNRSVLAGVASLCHRATSADLWGRFLRA